MRQVHEDEIDPGKHIANKIVRIWHVPAKRGNQLHIALNRILVHFTDGSDEEMLLVYKI